MKHVRFLISHPLISQSGILFIGSNITNVLQFLFTLFLSRNLSPAEFGIYTAIISLITIPLYEAGAIVPMIVNFAGTYYAKNDLASVRGLFFKISKAGFMIGATLFLLLLLFSKQVDAFFKVNDPFLIVLAGLCILLIFISLVNIPLLQAKLAFRFITLVHFSTAVIKLLSGLLLVWAGFGVRGAIIALLIAYTGGYLLSFLQLRFLFDRRIKKTSLPVKELFKYGIPSALALLGITSLITTDLLIVKHFLTPDQAGIYSGISLVARVIFFLTAPIGMVMFPLIVQQKARGENYLRTFQFAFLLTLVPSIFLTIMYFILPNFVILFFLKKEEYLAGVPLLGIFAIFLTIYSLIYVTGNFLLSIGKTKVYIPILVTAFTQGVLIWTYHASLTQVVLISLLTSLPLLVIFVGIYINLYGKKT